MSSQKNLFAWNVFLFYVLLIISFLFFKKYSFAEDAKKKEAQPAQPGTPVPIPPLPRHVDFPSITYGKEPSVDGEKELDLSKMRFWYIAVIASWNPRSEEITDILNKNFKQFSMRKVGVLTLFSNDTMESVNAWRVKNKPLFMNEFASRDFLDSLKNPKIPTVWLIGKQGEVLQQIEIPTQAQMIESVQKVMILTGF